METFSPELLRIIETMETNDARQYCIGIINDTRTKVDRKHALLRDLQSAPNPKELSRIMWNVLLAGEGLSVADSKWQSFFGGKK